MKTIKIILLIFTVQFFILSPVVYGGSSATDSVSSKERCPVCGMFVAKYPDWITQIHYERLSQTRFFDGVKDMMVYYFNPERFEGPPRESIQGIFVKDYYSLKWLPAKEAFYVIGSDVYGPMGNEFIPFETKKAAESFMKDHHGQMILAFDEISPGLVQSMRAGQRMR